MRQYFAYVRVSTVKQGTHGVSLQEQRDAILRYAERNHLSISAWFEESETAAKQGRPVFTDMIKKLRKGHANGVLLHKLDRGARNLKDWAMIGEMSDQGIEFHFANEGLDLHSRGGRLSADIQAVVAADFIRNLREETRKGFYGRLKQGLYPLSAPLGYDDNGKGKPKTMNPIMGPLVQKAFELYGTGMHTLESLGEEMFRLGLRNRNGRRVTRNGLSTMLNNPFYMGIIRLRKTEESFPGIHTPLIPPSLFNRVQTVLSGKFNRGKERHALLYRRLVKCGTCGYSLIGERQKGHVYYRCHTKTCSTSVREESIEAEMLRYISQLHLNDEEVKFAEDFVAALRTSWKTARDAERTRVQMQLGQSRAKQDRLTDAFLDQVLEKSDYDRRRMSLIMEQKGLEEQLENIEKSNGPDRLAQFLELVKAISHNYARALPEEKRQIIKAISSNRVVLGKKPCVEPSIPFNVLYERYKNRSCDLQRDIYRTFEKLAKVLSSLEDARVLPNTVQHSAVT